MSSRRLCRSHFERSPPPRRSSRNWLLAGAVALAFVAGCTSSGSISSQLADRENARPAALEAAPPGTYPPNRAELDRLLAEQRWDELVAVSNRTTEANALVQLLNWEKDALTHGRGGLMIALGYSRDLWRLGSALERSGQQGGGELKKTAGLITLYAYALVVVDGQRCADPSAPEHRLQQITSISAEPRRLLASLPEEERRTLVRTAAAMEAKTERPDDETICRGGMDEIRSSLEKFPSGAREVPAGPGDVGRQVAVQHDPSYRPKFLDRNVWQEKVVKARAALPAFLAKLSDLPAG